MSDTSSAQASFPFLGILALIFITLKLTNVIAWSWWWVLAPLWMPFAILIGFAAVLFIIGLVFQSRASKPKDDWFTK